MVAIRCFIGFFVPDEVKDAVLDVQNGLSRLPAKYKMVERENLHINVSYLGEKGVAEVDRIESCLRNVCLSHKSFDVNIGVLTAFPNRSRARVMFLKTSDDSGELEDITRDVLVRIGGDSNPPHITLCRVKIVYDKDKFLKGLTEVNYDGPNIFRVGSVSLIESVLSPNGPKYTIRSEFKLEA